jgi:hypothetical protein
MNEEHVEKFLSQLSPFEGLWQSFRVFSIAVRKEGFWISLGTRLVLREEALPVNRTSNIVEYREVTPRFLAAVFDFSITRLSQSLQQILHHGRVILETESSFEEVFLSRAYAGLMKDAVPRLSWSGAITSPRSIARQHFGINRTCIFMSGQEEKINDLADAQLLGDADAKLRMLEPPVDGVEALTYSLLPGLKLGLWDAAVVAVIAPLPFDLEYIHGKGLALKATDRALNGDLRITAFFRPQGGSQSRALTPSDLKRNAPSDAVVLPIEWPKGAEWAKLVLLYNQKEIDTLEVCRWPAAATLRVAVDSYFDPDHQRLRGFVLGRESKEGRNFELGVVRLMNLLGVPFVWYGKGSTQGRPDVAAALVETDDLRVVLLGECTREKPESKFSPLADRAREIREFLGGDNEILGVVFTPITPVPSVVGQATEHGIALVGRGELESLLKLLNGHTATGEVVRFLRELTMWSPFRPATFEGTV